MSIRKFFKDNGMIIASIASLVVILSYTGFNLNIPAYYKSLQIESKIIFVLLVNAVFTFLAMFFVLNQVKKK